MKYLAFFAALALVFSSCTKDEELTQPLMQQGVGVERSAYEGESSVDANGTTAGPSNLPGNTALPPIVDDEDDENDDDSKGIVDDEDDENDDDKPKK